MNNLEDTKLIEEELNLKFKSKSIIKNFRGSASNVIGFKARYTISC